MAKITASDSYPARESVHFSFAEGEFDLDGKTKSYSTDDAALLRAAEAHPWLEVAGDDAPYITSPAEESQPDAADNSDDEDND